MARRLSKTAVLEAVKATKTGQLVETVGDTEHQPDGRREVRITLFDTFVDPRDPAETPAGAALIGHLEAQGWRVAHRRGRRYSSLDVYEPAVPPASQEEES